MARFKPAKIASNSTKEGLGSTSSSGKVTTKPSSGMVYHASTFRASTPSKPSQSESSSVLSKAPTAGVANANASKTTKTEEPKATAKVTESEKAKQASQKSSSYLSDKVAKSGAAASQIARMAAGRNAFRK